MKHLADKVLSFNGLACGYVAAVVAWFAVWLVFGEPGLLMVVLNRAAAWMFVPAAVLAAAAILKRNWPLAVLQLLPVGIFAFLYWPYLVPGGGSVAGSAPSSRVRVMTFNLHSNDDRCADIAETMRALDPDVICLQEVTEEAGHALSGLLAGAYPWSHIGGQGEGGACAIFSRLQPGQFEEIPLPPSMPAVLMTLATPGGSEGGDGVDQPTLAVISAHLSSYQLHGLPVRAYGQHIRDRTSAQHRQARRLAWEVLKRKQPTILGIDANATETCLTYRVLARSLTSTARAIGWRTNDRPPPDTARDTRIGRIDYLFFTHPGIEPEGIYRGKDGAGPDHEPVIGDFYVAGVHVAALRRLPGTPSTDPSTNGRELAGPRQDAAGRAVSR